MSESKTVVLNLRLAPVVMASLEARAAMERRPVRSMAALLIEDGLARPRLAHTAPLVPPTLPLMTTEVTPRFRPEKKGKRR